MDPDLIPVAAAQGGVVLRRQALAAGYQPAEIDRLLRGEWIRVRPGAYAERRLVPDGNVVELHRLRLRAVLISAPSSVIVCATSAAVVHGLSLWRPRLDRVHLSSPTRSGIEADVHWHRLVPPPEDLIRLDGMCVTTLARTTIDVARKVDFEAGVVLADSALRRLDGMKDALDDTVGRLPIRMPGRTRALRVIAAADGRAQNPAESRTRVALAGLGLPQATPQVFIYDELGRLIGIADLGLIGQGVLVEFDGRAKYGIDGADPLDQLLAEKVRGDLLGDVGYELARPMWADLDPPARLERKVRAALARAAGRPVPGGWYRLGELRNGRVRPYGPFLRPFRS